VASKPPFREARYVPADSSKKEKASPARKQFATALRKARKALPKPLSQEALADKAGLERSYVGQVERGEVNISIDNMHKLAVAVGKPLWELLKP
jgi:ribosome-binding protein aMBF1 (putative translation factor)